MKGKGLPSAPRRHASSVLLPPGIGDGERRTTKNRYRTSTPLPNLHPCQLRGPFASSLNSKGGTNRGSYCLVGKEYRIGNQVLWRMHVAFQGGGFAVSYIYPSSSEMDGRDAEAGNESRLRWDRESVRRARQRLPISTSLEGFQICGPREN